MPQGKKKRNNKKKKGGKNAQRKPSTNGSTTGNVTPITTDENKNSPVTPSENVLTDVSSPVNQSVEQKNGKGSEKAAPKAAPSDSQTTQPSENVPTSVAIASQGLQKVGEGSEEIKTRSIRGVNVYGAYKGVRCQLFADISL